MSEKVEFVKKPIVYFASPYTHEHQPIVRQRVREIVDVTGRAINFQKDIIPISPIAYTDQFAYVLSMTEEDWRAFVLQYLSVSDGMIVVKMPGWESSVGIRKEISFCQEHRIPFIYSYPEDIAVACRDILDEINLKKRG